MSDAIVTFANSRGHTPLRGGWATSSGTEGNGGGVTLSGTDGRGDMKYSGRTVPIANCHWWKGVFLFLFSILTFSSFAICPFHRISIFTFYLFSLGSSSPLGRFIIRMPYLAWGIN